MNCRPREPRFLRSGLQVVLTATLLLCLSAGVISSKQLTIRVGTGYEFISQEFFLDSTYIDGADSLLSTWALTTDYLDDFKVRLSLDYLPTKSGTSLHARYEQTNEFIRGRISAEHKIIRPNSAFIFDGELETKNRYRGQSDFGDDYFEGFGRIRVNSNLNDNLFLRTQLKAEAVNFRHPGSYQFNYNKIGGSIGIEKTFENFSFANASFFLQNRAVPDTSEMSYLSSGLDLSYYGFYSTGDLYVLARIERKNYRQPEDKDDHYRFEISGQNKTRFGQGWFTRQDGTFEMTVFSPDDIVNYDYTRFGLGASLGFESMAGTITIGPTLEQLTEEKTNLLGGENYKEYGARLEFDYLKGTSLFLSLESSLGIRDLKQETEFQTGFTFHRITLLSDITLANHWNLNLLFSAEWEWHEISSEDSRLYLLSSNFSYRF